VKLRGFCACVFVAAGLGLFPTSALWAEEPSEIEDGSNRKQILVYGTVHNMIPTKELNAILDKNQPDLILVDEYQDNIKMNRLNQSPQEVKDAIAWANANYVNIFGFGLRRTVVKKPLPSKKQLAEVAAAQKKILKGKSWKDANKRELASLEAKAAEPVIDQKALAQNRKQMLARINEYLPTGNKVVIFVGAAHLEFFQKNLPDAVFPLR